MNFSQDKTYKVNRSGIRSILRDFLIVAVNGVILFSAAGTIKWLNAWIYIGLVLIHQITIKILLIIKNPELLNEQGRAIKKASIFSDRIFIFIYPLATMVLSFMTGISSVRFKLVGFPSFLMIPGIVLFICSSFFGSWAILVNKHFKADITVRGNSNHKIRSKGPYRYVRHPGYAAWVMSAVSYPLIMSSPLSYSIISVMIVLFILRIWHKDNIFHHKLAGYKEYARETRYRLFPFVW